jgi:antitoxin MazE
MQSQTLKVVRIGNSRGVRLPAPMLSHYRIGHAVIAERTADGILLRPKRDGRLSWEDTFRATGAEQRKKGDEFSALDAAAGDGLAALDR